MMQNKNRDIPLQPFFSHIYVEEQVWDHPRTRKMLAKFPSATVIAIGHYKDVFCRGRQNHALQLRSRNLILAAKTGRRKYEGESGHDANGMEHESGFESGALLYKGAPVCQSFGQERFYYTSCIMNCAYDCEYCYLKGMYPSAHIVVFVNIEDIFAQTERLLADGPLYLCVSYDTDLAALEPVAGYVAEWTQFAQMHTDRLTIEIRTKCANRGLFQKYAPLKNVIYAFTLSPQAIVEAFERHTPSLSARIACAADALQRGFAVRLCFDPMIYVKGWERHYKAMLEEAFSAIDPRRLTDVSAGTFRIAKDYLKNMRKRDPDSAVAWFPYELEDGYCHYPNALMERMEGRMAEWLSAWLPEEKIFLWRDIHS